MNYSVIIQFPEFNYKALITQTRFLFERNETEIIIAPPKVLRDGPPKPLESLSVIDTQGVIHNATINSEGVLTMATQLQLIDFQNKKSLRIVEADVTTVMGDALITGDVYTNESNDVCILAVKRVVKTKTYEDVKKQLHTSSTNTSK